MKAIKIAITGGPSGGKTTLIEALKKELGPRCAIVSEAASILYRGGFPRYKDTVGLVHAQRAIYFTQKELESLISYENQVPLLVCDRGSLDAIAYWPLTNSDFFSSMNTDEETELARYDWIIHLDTASADFYDTTNPIRTESFQEAQALNEKVKIAWSKHPHRIIISQNRDFISKMMTALSVIKAILSSHDKQIVNTEISNILQSNEGN